MQERVHELEKRYKSFLFRKYLKYFFFSIFAVFIILTVVLGVQKYNRQKTVYLEALEYKKNLEQKIMQAQILQEKNKISKEKLTKEIEELKIIQETLQTSKIEINSQVFNIADLKKAFYQNPSYDKALKLANQYFSNKTYKKSIFWALKANEIDRKKQESWVIFAKAKRALGEEKEAQIALDAYVNYYGFIELDEK